MRLAATERAFLADQLAAAGPDAPTLCEGWVTADLGAHLVLRERDPIGALGIVAPPLAGLTRTRMEALKRLPWAELVARVRRGPGGANPLRIPVLDELVNAVEFFIHAEDVRRAQPGGAPSRDLGPATEDAFWTNLRTVGRAWLKPVPTGLLVERSDTHEQWRVRPGDETVSLVGKPSELLLLASGRLDHAEVEVVGTDDAVARFRRALSS
jgi:uncharacterized protein (TIGR03085 family)